MPSFQQQLHLKKNWGNTYRANLRAAIDALPKFVPMPPLSVLRSTPPTAFDPAPFDAMRAAVSEANEALDSIRAALVLLQATPDYEFEEDVAPVQQEAAGSSLLTDADLARIYRRVTGATRFDQPALELMREVEHAVNEKRSSVQVDAGRYQWLRNLPMDGCWDVTRKRGDADWLLDSLRGADLDAAIDAALQPTQGAKGA